MDKKSFEINTVLRNGYSYKRYDLPTTDHMETSFFDISNINERNTMYNDASQGNSHSHSFCTIMWFFSGKGSHIVDFKEYKIKQDTIFFIAPNQLHTFRNLSKVKGIMMFFSEDLLLRINHDLQSRVKVHLFNPINGPSFCEVSEVVSKRLILIANMLKGASTTQYEDKDLQASYIASLLSLFLIDTIRMGKWNKECIIGVNSTSYQIFLSFSQMVERNFSSYHDVKDYAKHLGVSLTTLNLYVRQYTNTTPLNIITNRIILEAKRLILYSNMSIKQVSFKLGFEDPSYFIKYFKRSMGISPTEYKKLR